MKRKILLCVFFAVRFLIFAHDFYEPKNENQPPKKFLPPQKHHDFPPPHFSTPPKNEWRNFRGKRTLCDERDFFVSNIWAQNNSIFVRFSLPINPKTFCEKNVIVKNFPPLTKENFKFDREGRVAQILFFDDFFLNDPHENFFLVEMYEIESFDGKKIAAWKSAVPILKNPPKNFSPISPPRYENHEHSHRKNFGF